MVDFKGVQFFDQKLANIKLELEGDIGTWYLPNDFDVLTTNSANNYKIVKESCEQELMTLEGQIEEYKELGFSLFEKYLHDINSDGEKDAFLLLKEEKSNNSILSILINDNGSFNIWKQNSKIISNVDYNSCPAEGFSNIAFKNSYFTIEESICDGWLFVDNYVTFKYDKSVDDIYLHKHGLIYTDRRNPDKKIPEKILTREQFGKISFKKYDNTNINWVK